MSRKNCLQIGSLYALLAVILGAFGAHALDGPLSPERLDTFETGVRYQMYHALALLLLTALVNILSLRTIKIVGWLFFVGVLLFSGSIYLLACRDLLGLTHWRWLGPLTPIGGTCLIIGWGVLFFSSFRN